MMNCSQCGNALKDDEKFCSKCGTSAGKTEAKKETKNQTAPERWPKKTDDDYRNKIVRSARIITVVEFIIFLACLNGAMSYKKIYGWGWMFVGLLASNYVMAFIMWLFGANKYFGSTRLKQYDQLIAKEGKSIAITILESKKGGIIRKILIILAVIGSLDVSGEVCYRLMLNVVANRIEHNLSGEKSFWEKLSSWYSRDVEDPYKDVVGIEETLKDEASQTNETNIQSSNFKVNDTVSTDNFDFTVTNAYVVDLLEEGKKIPEGAVYVAVEYEYKNISKQPISTWSLPTVHLIDGNDAQYTQDADASWYFDKYSDSKILSDLNPGIKTKDAKIFEVAIDVLNAGGMRVYVEADRDFLVDLDALYYEEYLGDAEYKHEESSESEYLGYDNVYTNDEYLGNVKADSYYEETSSFILPEVRERYYSTSELSYLSKAQLRLARNEIYACHGRLFQSEDLNTYFSAQDWYYGYLTADEFDESVLNQYEKANLDILKSLENQ